MEPKYKKSQLVRVFLYYQDMIVKDSFPGMILGVETYDWTANPTHIYHVMSLKDNKVHTAEEFSIDLLEGETTP